ncbi:hypothetical protein O3Q51_15925 [Cryomorphaceae bacterium 1068]|nr:hypothetical protein [Cryomorphaceae bacterium 1068]
MYKSLTVLLLIVSLMTITWMVSISSSAAVSKTSVPYSDPLKNRAYNILDSKCNVCHRKQNPFMVFNLKNMDKRAKKINKNVFELQRMPKGDEIKLTAEERETLKNWIQSLNLK